MWIFLRPVVEHDVLLAASAEEHDAARGETLAQQHNDTLHESERINFSLVGGKGRNADPALPWLPLHVECVGQEREVVAPFGKNGLEIRFDRIPQLLQHIHIVSERCGLLHQEFVRHGREAFAPVAVLVDVRHTVMVDVEPHAQVVGAQHVVKISHGSEMLGCQAAVEGIEPLDPMIFLAHIGLHETDIGGQTVEQRTGHGTAEHGDAQVGVLPGKRINHGHRHGDVAECRETYDKDMFCLHFL